MNDKDALANHILSHLSPQGLQGIKTMLKADRFVVNPRGIAFRFRGSDRTNVVKIDQKGDNGFHVAFSKMEGIHFTHVCTADDIPAENLRQCFERETSLATAIPAAPADKQPTQAAPR